jgi:hypothetical protein
VPVSYSIDGAKRVVRLRYEGVVSYEEWSTAVLAVLSDPAYHKGFGFLGDRRTAVPATMTYVRATADFMKAHQSEMEGTRWAMIASEASSSVMMRIGQVFMNEAGVTIKVFTDIQAAEAWLTNTPADLA